MAINTRLKDFEEWLASRLRDLNADEAVFGPYIQSLLEDNLDDLEDQEEALDSFLAELMGPIEAKLLRKEIFSKWKYVTEPNPSSKNSSMFASASASSVGSCELNTNPNNISLDKQLDQILRIASESIEEQASCRLDLGKGSSSQILGQPDSQLRAKILSHMAESESDSEDELGTSKKKHSESTLPLDVGRQANVSKLLNEQKEKKDIAKAEAAKKREKDKEDRAKQKATTQDRKDKAKKKATKVERKR